MININTYINETNFPKATTTEITDTVLATTATTKLPPTTKLKGKLEIKDYPNLTKIDLRDHDFGEVVIINCPELKEIDLPQNKITKLDIEKIKIDTFNNPIPADKLTSLAVGENLDLEEVSLRCFPNLTHFLALNNKKIDKTWGLDKLYKLKKVVLEDGLIRYINNKKWEYLDNMKKAVKSSLGLGPNDRLDITNLKDKINSSVNSQIPQLKTEKENAEKERDTAQAQLAALQAERDQLQQNFQAIVKKLGLTDQSTQAQVLTKIEELMNKPDNDNSGRISDLERQLSEKNQRISELESGQNGLINKQSIVESLKDSSFSISAARRAEIVDASTSQEAWKIRDRAIKERFSELEKARKNTFYISIVLGVLLVLSLFVIGWLIWKNSSSAKEIEPPLGQSKKKTKPKIKSSS